MLALGSAARAQADAPSVDKPNLVLILVDDMGYGDASCYGGKDFATPNIDRLAEEGVRFTDGYACHAVCGPSRVGLMTGAYPARFGVYWNPDMGPSRIPNENPLLPVTLKQAGYTTGFVGKWNFHNPDNTKMPAQRYFDKTYDVMIWEGDYWPNEDGAYHGVEDRHWGSSKTNGAWGPLRKGDQYLTDRLTDRACEFIDDNAGRPFFLYLAYNAPHSPLQAKLAHRDQVAHLPTEPDRLYAAMVLAIDEGVGRVMAQLQGHGLDRNTLVVFTSDNGPAKTNFKGIPDHWPRNQMLGSTGGLNGGKGRFYEGGIRVPLILRWPEHLAAGATESRPVTAADLYPTFCAAAGAEGIADIPLDGVDLLPYLAGENDDHPHDLLFWSGGKHVGAVRQGDWKWVLHDDAEPQLFNLAEDVGETTDHATDEPQIAKRLSDAYAAWFTQCPASAHATEQAKIGK